MVKKKGGGEIQKKKSIKGKKSCSFVTKKRAFERDCLNKWDELGEEEKKKERKNHSCRFEADRFEPR